tara:strand:+ start:438 stop:2243 length:1806 start_codon:yes stop_codon:yes gene_type:complete
MQRLRKIFKFLGRFLEKTRIFFLNFITALVLIFVLIFILGLFSTPDPVDNSGKVLVLDPSAVIVDEEVFGSDFIFSEPVEQLPFREFDKLISKIAQDDSIPAILIDFSNTSFAGPTTLLNVAKSMQQLHDKEVIAYSERFDMTSFMMAAQADEIWIHQSGNFYIQGLGGYRNYLKDFYNNIKASIHNYSQGDYKSATETLTRNEMSEFDRIQRQAIYDPIWKEIKNVIATNRGLDIMNVQFFADNFMGILGEASFDNIDYAIDKNFIDGTKSYPEFRSYMIKKFGLDDESEYQTYNKFSYLEYMDTYSDDANDSANIIAIITAEGAIQEGEIAPGIAGSNELAQQIRKAHEDEQTQAIILRVNSPGGSIIGSEMIRDELFEAKRKEIPVVISMGDYAASGGVYISTPGDYIFAEPTTVTGSIGVAIAFATFEGTINYAGINLDGVTTSEMTGWDITMGVDEKLNKIFESWGNRAYERFISVVSESRNLTPEYVKTIAGGRVWIGSKAVELGLVDELGGIDAAIEKAAELAQLENYKVSYITQELSPKQLLLREILGSLNVTLTDSKTFSALDGIISLYSDFIESASPQAMYLCNNCLVRLD